MATVADISQSLGDYMLKGWVLTDQSCPTPGCAVPLLRSPKGRTPITSFCVKCSDENALRVQPRNHALASSSYTSTESQISRASTPPTEFSEIPESPVFLPLEESDETRRRRAQSDQASSEIGRRLLKGWAMLGDECPNEMCYGVPLVRPPKSGGEKDPRKECVICGNTYVSEVDWAGKETLVFQEVKSNAPPDVRTQGSISYIPPPSAQDSETTYQPLSSPFGRKAAEEEQVPPQHSSHPLVKSVALNTNPISPSTSSRMVVEETSEALQASLRALTRRLTSMTSHSMTDLGSLGATADAITKVAQALVQVRQLQKMQIHLE
ncbi:hypothetical protein GALMADRAFT_236240 [Galerina marginata CBS 339.88]|uniref:Sjogrens syndrome scleroderma autoantigen 1 family protein n=1 Tax=Galerina marginata (strain CBS 339.88) TaxID=685588 RepID=A0A067TXR1_GALM3|nr:hypothetical protein GALMADRAFT_236240 [Galerina marginata CBS 339.88]